MNELTWHQQIEQDMKRAAIWQPKSPDASDTHKCGYCSRREPTDGSFLGFHAHSGYRSGEVCDNCAELCGCECCHSLVVTAKRNMWQPFLESIGVDPDDVDFD